MKKILFILLLTLSVCTLIQGQTKTGTSVSRFQKSGPIPLSPPPATTTGTPDLKIVSLSIAKLSSAQEVAGQTKYAFEVSYVVKNEGNTAVDARLVSIDGTIDFQDATVPRPIGGCGSGLTTLSGEMIKPGATYGGSYRCNNVSLENSRKYIYYLKVDSYNKITELNEQNNSAQISILF